MSGWKYAFSLSKEEIRDAHPPGTVRLVGESRSIHIYTDSPSNHHSQQQQQQQNETFSHSNM